MSRRVPLLLLLLTVALSACGEAPSPPSIVLVTIDTLRADRLGSYGYFRDTSPHLDRLAAEGVLFRQARTTMATTLPAHVSLFTSLYPTQHGVRGNFEHLGRPLSTGESVGTLAEDLLASGWQTAAFVAAAPLKKASGIAAGFAVYDEPERESRRAGVVVERALAWLDRRNEAPFFLWLHLWDPHHPYQPPPEFPRVYEGDEAILPWMAERGFAGLDDPDVMRQNNAYDDEIRYVDTQMGVLLAGLRQRGLYDEVAIVVTSDHGEGLGQHDWLRHGRIFEEQLRIPLVARFPTRLGVEARIDDAPASLVDVVPTLVDRLGLPVPKARRARMMGRDLLGERSGGSRLVFAERVARSRAPWEGGDKYTLTDGEWKYFHLTEARDELFHLATDPFELVDVADEYPEVARRLRERLDAVREELARSALDRDHDGLSEQRRRELESLGYVE